MAIKTSPLHIEDYLKTDEDIKEFLQELSNTGTYSDFIHGLSTASKAKGMTEVAQQVGVTCAGLNKSLSEDGNPEFETINKIVKALGCRLVIV
ncbi:putative addiction module antidote protein [Thiotrichales bacterium HSG1]|nr:putative addiction module antidote protein [Thiotrichales bacterium HSG1]